MGKAKVGKGVIDSLTSSMYDDSRFIFREYIQNSADSIDKAIQNGIIINKDQGSICIEINQAERRISILDNGQGIASKQAEAILKNIGSSTKKRGVDKGFRGIGRLGGLAYCNKLIIRTSSKGEDVTTILEWDATLLQSIIDDHTSNLSAAEVVDEVTTTTIESESPDEHYFEVILEDVTKPELLDESSVREYLEMVAPIPFAPNFLFKGYILQEAKKHNIVIDEYNVSLNSAPLYKPYNSIIYTGEKGNLTKDDEIYDIGFFKEEYQGEMLFWGWYSISNFNKQVQAGANPARGIRLRKFNIQVGGEERLNQLHKENRGNGYFFGEVYGIHKELLPNARRDYFTENPAFQVFERKLKSYFHTTLEPLYRDSSKIRSEIKKIEGLKAAEDEFKKRITQNLFSSNQDRKREEEELEKKRQQAEKSKEHLDRLSQKSQSKGEVHEKLYERLTSSIDTNNGIATPKMNGSNGKAVVAQDPVTTKYKSFGTQGLYIEDRVFSSLSKKEKKVLSKVIQVIDTVLVKEMAENVKGKIKEEFSK